MKINPRRSFLTINILFIIILSCNKKVTPDKNIKAGNSSVEKENAKIDSTISTSLWKELPHSIIKNADSITMRFKNYRLFEIDSLAIRTILSKAPAEKFRDNQSMKLILELPMPGQGFMKFNVYRTTVMDSALEAAYPLLKTYGGQGMDDRTATLRLDFNVNGFHAYVISQSGEWFIQPAHGIPQHYLFCFYKRDFQAPDRRPFELPDSMKK